MTHCTPELFLPTINSINHHHPQLLVSLVRYPGQALEACLDALLQRADAPACALFVVGIGIHYIAMTAYRL